MKIPIKNVYHMLLYAYDMLKSKEYARLASENCESVHDLLAALLLRGTQTLIKRGFLKNYISQTEETAAIRGKLDVANSLRRLSLQNARAICIFDDFSNNISFNQILKATFLHLAKQPIQPNLKKDVRTVLAYFNEISTIGTSTIKWDSLAFNRNNAHYDTILYFCRLICENAIANRNSGEKSFATIEDKFLPELFEKFIFAFCKRHLKSPKYAVYRHEKINWQADNLEMLPQMQTDITVSSGCRKLIIDTKFYSKTLQSHYLGDNRKIISANLYQIFSYVKNAAAQSPNLAVSGMLLYPQVDTPLDKYYFIDGNNFFVQTVNLNQDFSQIVEDLLRIVQK
ncbi:MAG: 5-methylcytosine-specific restriction endonuclease system specificity protein McrC [Firmicutes bacterium]|nr:5-methylcytosine-specific restriction endonuclease system specificity protein McrC [Bacillota bacterium]